MELGEKVEIKMSLLTIIPKSTQMIINYSFYPRNRIKGSAPWSREELLVPEDTVSIPLWSCHSHWSLCTLQALDQQAKEGGNLLAVVRDPASHEKL